MMRSKIFVDNEDKGLYETVWLWVAHALVGIVVGVITFIMSLCVDQGVALRTNIMQMLLD